MDSNFVRKKEAIKNYTARVRVLSDSYCVLAKERSTMLTKSGKSKADKFLEDENLSQNVGFRNSQQNSSGTSTQGHNCERTE